MFDILISTYNGEKYLAEQLDSIINQSYSNWKVIIRDDGSSDSTLSIIKNYIQNYPNRIELLESNDNLGPMLSFGELLKISKSKYIALCDQDDVWLCNKLELFYNKITDVEKKYPDKPILIHSDIYVTDPKLNIVSQSFWKKLGLNPKVKSTLYYLTSNNVTGCSIVLNKELKDLILPIPKEASMHDWWISLNASYFGIIDYFYTKTMYYRQHDGNVVGARNIIFRMPKFFYFLHKIKVQSDHFAKVNSLRSISFLEIIILKVFFLIKSIIMR